MKTNFKTNTNTGLAVYAMDPVYSKGRKFKEKEHAYRSMYQRDRDRIIYSTAFRRMQYKTQVFVNHEGDHYRTRLTHTLEVVQIARTIAKALKLNEELVEAIALAHDIGHTPFGHAGEEALSEIMRDYGGFDHNLQGLRVVDLLEERYPDFQGLNLTWEVREGISKHTTIYDKPPVTEFEPGKLASLEAQVVDAADEIAYNNHDLEDGITSGLINKKELEKITIWDIAEKKIKKQNANNPMKKYLMIRMLIDMQVSDLINESAKKISEYSINTPEKARTRKQKLIYFNPKTHKLLTELEDFLFKNLYRHFKVVRMSSKAKRFITEIFEVYLNNPDQLPPSTKAKLIKSDSHRIICDYVAGMTDRYLLDEYKKLFDPWEKV